jgi:SAM-dependent methyltransferase
MTFASKDVGAHFDKVAADYDYWKTKNWYYYDELKKIAREYVGKSDSVLDAGSGTGTILNDLEFSRGVGIDISPEMVETARNRSRGRKDLRFLVADIARLDIKEKFDVILLFDVVEHLPNPIDMFRALEMISAKDGKIVVTMANPLWEPILALAEKFGLKMPEGPHRRISGSKLTGIAENVGLKLVSKDHRLLFPKYIPVFSYVFNSLLAKLPIIKSLSVMEIYIFSK